MVHMNQFYTLLADFNPNLKFKSHVRTFVLKFLFYLCLYITKESIAVLVLLSVIINTDLNLMSIFSICCCLCVSCSVAVK